MVHYSLKVQFHISHKIFISKSHAIFLLWEEAVCILCLHVLMIEKIDGGTTKENQRLVKYKCEQ